MRQSALIIVIGISIMAGSVSGLVHEISVDNSGFSPIAAEIRPGDTVSWTILEGTHTISSDPGSALSWNSGQMSEVGQNFDLAFGWSDGVGPFPYHCADHPDHRDTIFTADTCYADGDFDGDGSPLSVADLIYILKVISGQADPPVDLYRADLNGDCIIDAGDADMYAQFFTYGFDVFEQFPVPTCCYPSIPDGIDCCLAIGDINHSGGAVPTDVIDILALVSYLFQEGDVPFCLDETDATGGCEGVGPDVIDLLAIVGYLFQEAGDLPACHNCGW